MSEALEKTTVSVPAVNVATSAPTKTARLNARMYEDDFDHIVYWSEKFEMDRTEFLVEATRHYVRWRNGDYDLPTAEAQRLNQLVDVVQNLAVTTANLQETTVSGFDAMLGVMRGDNYLIDEEDGNL